MAIKKNKYPSIQKPGVYPDGDDKQLGLDNSELETFSLGSWTEFEDTDKQLWFGLPPAEVVQIDPSDKSNPHKLSWKENKKLAVSGCTQVIFE